MSNLGRHLNIQPDFKPDGTQIIDALQKKAVVLYFPIYEELRLISCEKGPRLDSLHIIWPHRWEHDKNPESLFQALYVLQEQGVHFSLSVLGESYAEIPSVFEEAKLRLKDNIHHFGFAESREKYYQILRTGDVIVSTALHEFFGVSMLEGTYLGCFPVVPDRLVYPELYPPECIYRTDAQLCKKLKKFALNPTELRNETPYINYDKFSFDSLYSLLMAS